jgi:hypothetical protein
LPVGNEPESIALTPDNQFAYVANARGNSVTVIQINDPAWGTFSANVISNFVTGAEPWNIVCSPGWPARVRGQQRAGQHQRHQHRQSRHHRPRGSAQQSRQRS